MSPNDEISTSLYLRTILKREIALKSALERYGFGYGNSNGYGYGYGYGSEKSAEMSHLKPLK